jgi:histone H1/5
MRVGDHIRITKGGGAEHAIDVGDRTVIHFAIGEGVKRSRLAELASDGARVEVVTHRERVFPRKQVVARAFSRFAESAYAAMFQDSEAFAIWCKNGKIPVWVSAVPPALEPGSPTHEAPRPDAAPHPVRVKPVKRKVKHVAKVAAGRAAKKPVAKKPVAKKPVAKKPVAKKPAAKKGVARAKAARSTKTSSPAKASRTKKASSPRRSIAPAKKAASTKAAVSAKRTVKAGARKPSRTTKSVSKTPRSGQAQKRTVPARSPKQKRRKAPGGRAAAGR